MAVQAVVPEVGDGVTAYVEGQELPGRVIGVGVGPTGNRMVRVCWLAGASYRGKRDTVFTAHAFLAPSRPGDLWEILLG